MTREEKNAERSAKVLSGAFVVLLFALMLRLWPVLIASVAVCAVSGAMCLYYVKRAQKSEEKPCGEEPPKAEQTDLHAQFCGLVGAMIAKEYPECDWQWEHPDPLALLKKGEDVYVFLRQKEGYKRALVQMQGFFPKGLTFPDEQKQENAEPPKQIAERVDYDLVAFEWMEANLARLNERCNDAIGAGEGELVLSPSELPERGSWEKLCEMLQREGLQGVQPTEDAIKITLSTAVERRNNVKRDQSV